jgi:hypothetical protein
VPVDPSPGADPAGNDDNPRAPTVRVRAMRRDEAHRVGELTLAAYDRYGTMDGDYRAFLGDPLARLDGCTAVLVAEDVATGEVLGTIIYVLLQQSVLNYRDFMYKTFSRDLADSITWQLLPLGATAPADTVQFMKVDTKASINSEVGSFIDALRERMAQVEDAGGDVARIATTYDIHLQSKKKLSSADIAVAVSNDAGTQVVHRKVDPNKTYPYNMTELLRRVNERRSGRTFNSRDFQAICWKYQLREDERYACRHKHGASFVWSSDALNLFVNIGDQEADRIRAEYGAAHKKS